MHLIIDQMVLFIL